MANTLQDVLTLCKEKEVKIVDFKMTDIAGRWRHLSIPVERLNQDTLTHGIGFDGSNYGYASVEKSDMVFVPDLGSATMDPFAQIPTLSMIGDVMVIDHPRNHPFDQYPRNVAKRAIAYMQESGIADEMIIGPEFEFYLFDGVQFDTQAQSCGFNIDCVQAHYNSSHPNNNFGYQLQHATGYHAALPLDVNHDLRSQITLDMEAWGIDVKYHHHEVGGCGQMEVETELGDMVAMADATMATKYIIKNEAICYGKTATFMPKPLTGEAGSGMHVHMLLKKNGKPLFYDEKGYAQLSDTALYFIGGLLKHAASLCAITNPSTNSYKRLVPGYEAPVTIGYATANRSAVVRIPAYAKSPDVKRFELRNPDATCNPYYAYAAILMAGLDGIETKIDPRNRNWGPFDCNLFALNEKQKAKLQALPDNLKDAAAALEKDDAYLTKGNVFPKELLNLIVQKDKADAEKVARAVHPQEFALYYDL